MKKIIYTAFSLFLSATSVFLFTQQAIAASTDEANVVKIKMETSMGEVMLELYPDKAPETVKNFLNYTNAGTYDGTIFHRVIKGFMNQGGGFTKDYERTSTNNPIRNEADNGLENRRGTIAMARTSDPHSATNQFFINTNNNVSLNHPGRDGWGYAVFGKVIDGMYVMDKIASVKTGAGGPFGSDAPKTQIIIIKMSEVKSASK